MSGSAGRRDRAHIAAREYFRANNVPCWQCGKPATIADHYPPLSTGLPTLERRPHCRTCSARQGALIRNTARTQDWPLQPWHEDRNVILIVGPPGAGKTTRATELAQHYGIPHFEREQYRTDDAYKQAVHQHCTTPTAQAVIVRTCTSLEQQAEWEQLAGTTQVEIIATPFDECASRIYARHRTGWRGEVAAAKRWHTMRANTPQPSRQW